MAGGSAQELLDVLTLLEGAFPSAEGGKSNVCFLENRDASHAWLRTPPAPVTHTPTLRVVHLRRSTRHAISGRGD